MIKKQEVREYTEIETDLKEVLIVNQNLNYCELENNLKEVLNGRLNKKNAEIFLNSIKCLKQDFNKRISTKFLRGLINPIIPDRKKTKRINYLLKKSGLTTKKEIKFNIPEWVFNTYFVDVVDYCINENEKVIIQDIRNQDIGKEFIQQKSEVLHFINI